MCPKVPEQPLTKSATTLSCENGTTLLATPPRHPLNIETWPRAPPRGSRLLGRPTAITTATRRARGHIPRAAPQQRCRVVTLTTLPRSPSRRTLNTGTQPGSHSHDAQHARTPNGPGGQLQGRARLDAACGPRRPQASQHP